MGGGCKEIDSIAVMHLVTVGTLCRRTVGEIANDVIARNGDPILGVGLRFDWLWGDLRCHRGSRVDP